MGRSVNKVQIIGTLGRDPEMKYLPSGSAVVTVSVATDESYNDKNSGQKVEKTEWHRLTAFGKLAEIIGQYLKKGSKAYFEGKLRTNEYEKDGIKRYSTEIVVNDMMMLDGRPDAGVSQGFANTAPMAQAPSAAMGQQPAQQQGGFAPQGQQPAQQQGGFAPQGQPAQRPARQPTPSQQGGFVPQQPAQQPQQGGYSQPGQAQGQPAQQPQAAPQPANNFDSFDDDIPF
ncbi:MAG: single-stranded DNA-binding protein [Oleispira sp.]|nr:single-stranded DNA-binding protein [Oleispira sp.]MBL4882667.1 single-stranded DNA-binding protein [Oleispira sp.]